MVTSHQLWAVRGWGGKDAHLGRSGDRVRKPSRRLRGEGLREVSGGAGGTQGFAQEAAGCLD